MTVFFYETILQMHSNPIRPHMGYATANDYLAAAANAFTFLASLLFRFAALFL